MKQYNEILEKMIGITNTMNKTSKCPRDFGVGVRLYPSEIHTIEAIGVHEPMNAKALAQALGITNGAVTQITDKLQKKGMVEKFKMEGNQKTVYIRLTALGRTAEHAHDRFHEKAYQSIADYLSNLTEDQRMAILNFLNLYMENLPKE